MKLEEVCLNYQVDLLDKHNFKIM